MELKHTIELIHLSAQHATREIRHKAITEYLRCHPEINVPDPSLTGERRTGGHHGICRRVRCPGGEHALQAGN